MHLAPPVNDKETHKEKNRMKEQEGGKIIMGMANTISNVNSLLLPLSFDAHSGTKFPSIIARDTHIHARTHAHSYYCEPKKPNGLAKSFTSTPTAILLLSLYLFLTTSFSLFLSPSFSFSHFLSLSLSLSFLKSIVNPDQ
jgi:hypothetical protein